ncbi:Fe(3+)-hydroxamate ABC transporter permease FhuB [Pararobbsia silviterrae]|uniref:Fe(3+)-hydroxamate ABC transporter permease FhuB n=2 Tax=Pararobbsia silviterrae TaxID=1792498 RepID=A0A494Y7P4_9BURK|nr:Fe(3+)-hydroxamate ABC transporter permease FhuB [Pararobbsia silviterrae]
MPRARASHIGVRPTRRVSIVLLAVAVLAACALSLVNLHDIAAPHLWIRGLLHPDPRELRTVIIHDSWMPRIGVAWLAGAMLGLAGTIFQQVLRNPIAEPMTLGVSSGAQLALTLATLYAPAWLAGATQTTALAGAACAAVLVFGLAWRSDLTPTTVAVAGMVVSLFCGSVTVALQLIHAPYLRAVFIWGGGSLVQQDWTVVAALGPQCVVGAVLAWLLLLPMVLLGLDDTNAQNLGFSVRRARVASLALAVLLAGMVVGAVGVIGFIGLAAPAIARWTGARRLGARLVASALCGAVLVWLTDQIVQLASGALGDLVPAGAVTALLGAPVMLLTVSRMRRENGTRLAHALFDPGGHDTPSDPSARYAPARVLGLALALLAGAVVCALMLGYTGHGIVDAARHASAHATVGHWHWATRDGDARIVLWRVPRVVGALASGAMLAIAGVLMQRVTANPLASPEMLGVSGGAALGMVVLMICAADATASVRLIASAAGAFAILAALGYTASRTRFAPEHVVLTGISISALSQAIVAVVIASGGERAVALLSWLSGSTYSITRTDAATAAFIGVALCATTPLLHRWLTILPLGDAHARGLGVNVGRARLAVLSLVALATASATLIVGPLSFVGLTAPHFARLAGARRPVEQLTLAAIAGAIVMVFADWLGREWLMPRELPAGLVATLIGAPYLMGLLARRR